MYSELGLESLADRRFYRRLIAFYKIVNKKAPQYLIDYLPTQDLASINLRRRPAIYLSDAREERSCNSFFPDCFSQWNNLDSPIRNLPSVAAFPTTPCPYTNVPDKQALGFCFSDSVEGWFQSFT